MEIQELLQLIRTCKVAQIRMELQRLKSNYPATYEEVVRFFLGASKQKEE